MLCSTSMLSLFCDVRFLSSLMYPPMHLCLFLTLCHILICSHETEQTAIAAPFVTHSPAVPHLAAGTPCKTTAKADIMLLVDGSWSIGRMNFKAIRNFIARMVSVFDIGPDKVQIGNTFATVTTSSDYGCDWQLIYEWLFSQLFMNYKSKRSQAWLSTAETRGLSGTWTPTQPRSPCCVPATTCRTKEATPWQVT